MDGCRLGWAASITAVTKSPAGTPVSGASSVVACACNPNVGWLAWPVAISSSATGMAKSTGIAKPRPTLPPPVCPAEFGTVMIAVLIPTSEPEHVTRAPPLLPGLIDASVWRASIRGRSARLRLRAAGIDRER